MPPFLWSFLARPSLRLTRHGKNNYLSPSFRVLLTPLTYVPVGEDAKTAKVFLGELCVFARAMILILQEAP